VDDTDLVAVVCNTGSKGMILSLKLILELTFEKETLHKNQEDLFVSCYCRN